MIDFILKRVEEDSPHFNLTFMKEVHKRNGDIVQEPAETIYTISLEDVKNRVSHVETATRLGNIGISLKEYLVEFRKSYRDVCELLKKTL